MYIPGLKSELSPRGISDKGMCIENKELLYTIYSAHKATFCLWHEVLDSGSHKEKIKEYVVGVFNLRAMFNYECRIEDRNLFWLAL